MDPQILDFLLSVHPYDTLPPEALREVAQAFRQMRFVSGALVYVLDAPIGGLYLIQSGAVEVTDRDGALVSLLGPRNSLGERGLLRGGVAVTQARATEDSVVLVLPAPVFKDLIARYPAFARFFNRGGRLRETGADLAAQKAGDLIARAPLSCPPETTAQEAAAQMARESVSSLGVTSPDGRLLGLVTTRDLCAKILGAGLSPLTQVAQVMTPDPITLPPDALGADLLHIMVERRIGHLPIVAQNRFLGMITQTDLTRFQAVSSARLIRDIAQAERVEDLAQVSAQIPQLLVQLVGSNLRHEVITRQITDISDAITRRLIALAEATLGAAPQPYLWLACGSQGRQEQSSRTDQDNCLIYDDAATPEDHSYFCALARFVCDGLNACGYVYCPGEMMAMSARWCQPARVWRDYFAGWIRRPDGEAQMLASVMFDLRPIHGAHRLFTDLQGEMLAEAAANSIFVAHMLANSLKHTPPLGLLRGFATIRSGEHRHHIDLKMNGVVPVVDLGRIYALQGQITAANTRARLVLAEELGVISGAGARDLTEAYDLIAARRLEAQAHLVKSGRAPDNYLAPSDLSDFERAHLRDAFVVVRQMQSAAGHGRMIL